MENHPVSRRINMITAHFAPSDDLAVTNLLPLSCSASLGSFIQRCDNRMSFARQGSSSQAYFMRPNLTLEANLTQTDLPLKSEVSLEASQGPLFSRPAIESRLPNLAVVQSVAPNFARPRRRICGRNQLITKEKLYFSRDNGIWSPRMDVAESIRNYVLTVEIPGVNIRNIRVEVDDHKLMITGHRSDDSKNSSNLNDKISAYHKREILQGPYRIVWPLPTNVNKDSVSAEFRDGFLRIIVPKV